MAGKKGMKRGSRKAANGSASEPTETVAVAGTNELTEGERQTLALSWLKQYEATLAAKNTAASAHSNLCKRMKTEIGADAVDLMKDMMAARTEQGEAGLKDKIERAMRAARYMAAPLGAQLDLLDMTDRTPAVDRATAEGLRDGKLGVTAHPDYSPETEQYRAYMEAWHAGQESIMDFQRAHDAAVFDAAENGDASEDTPPSPGAASMRPQFEDDAQIGDQPATFETTA